PGPCSDINYGQIEDYSIYIGSFSVDNNDFKHFSYYPNPVENVLNLKAGRQIENLSLFNMLGQTLRKARPHSLQTQLDTRGLQSGIYLLKVTIDGTSKSFTIVKK